MAHEFGRLSPADFEDLSRDLVGRALGVRFAVFAAGPDGGIDGRHAPAGGTKTILQAKHYVGSTVSALTAAMKRERASIDRLAPDRYILTTSAPLTPANKAALAAIIGASLQSEDDILGADDIRGLLRDFPDIEKSHIKLWLSNTAVLERVLRAASRRFTAITMEEIAAKVSVYAPNPSFDAARDILETRHVVIISGPPGVGKTTLGEMLSYAYLAEDWELVAIRGLDDGFAEIDDGRKQVFFFDDFLGRVALDRAALAHTDSELARFIRRVRKSKNARFILTTRAPIFEEARRFSEHLADRQLDIARYLLDVGVYTRRIRSRILYNHLLVAGTPQSHINALVASGKLPRIIDHKNFNPRIIEWMTDGARLDDVPAAKYPDAFVDTLANPGRLWETAFRNHIPRKCQHLLIALFFCSEYRTRLDELRVAFDALHPALCANYGESHDPKDFEDALQILEGGFVTLRGADVAFVNPSIRDYLTGYLDDMPLLLIAAHSARRTEWAKAVWTHSGRLKPSPTQASEMARAFLPAAELFVTQPVWRRVANADGSSLHADGLANVSRIELLLDWWDVSQVPRFKELAKALAVSPVEGLDSWRDGSSAIDLIARLREKVVFDEDEDMSDIANALETHAINMIRYNAPLEEIENIAESIDLHKDQVGGALMDAIRDTIDEEIRHVRTNIEDIDSESTLEDHGKALEKLAKHSSQPASEIQRALRVINDRKDELAERTSPSSGLSRRATSGGIEDDFDDEAVRNLFLPLMRGT